MLMMMMMSILIDKKMVIEIYCPYALNVTKIRTVQKGIRKGLKIQNSYATT